MPMCTMLNTQAKASTTAVIRRAKALLPRQRRQSRWYRIRPPMPKLRTATYWPGFCSTPSDHSLVSLSCTGTRANASVAIISQPMPRTGASSSSAEMSGLSSALAVMAQRMSTGM